MRNGDLNEKDQRGMGYSVDFAPMPPGEYRDRAAPHVRQAWGGKRSNELPIPPPASVPDSTTRMMVAKVSEHYGGCLPVLVR